MTVPFPLTSKWNGISIFTLQVYLSESSLVILIKVLFEQSDVFFCRELSGFFIKIPWPILVWFFSHVTVALWNSPVKQQAMFTVSPSLTETSELWVTRNLSDEAPIKKTEWHVICLCVYCSNSEAKWHFSTKYENLHSADMATHSNNQIKRLCHATNPNHQCLTSWG